MNRQELKRFILPDNSNFSRMSLRTYSRNRLRGELIWRTKGTEPGIKSGITSAHDIEERHLQGMAHARRGGSLKPPAMASRDTQGPFINTVSVGIYGPAALYKLAQWGALNKLDEACFWNTISGWPSAVTRTCARLFPLVDSDPTLGADKVKTPSEALRDGVRCISDIPSDPLPVSGKTLSGCSINYV